MVSLGQVIRLMMRHGYRKALVLILWLKKLGHLSLNHKLLENKKKDNYFNSKSVKDNARGDGLNED